MSRDKQIEEMVMVLTESQHAFDRAWKECLHNNAPIPDRENVFYAKYLVEKEGYCKASEIFEKIELCFSIKFGTYTKDDTVKITEVFEILKDIKERILGEENEA